MNLAAHSLRNSHFMACSDNSNRQIVYNYNTISRREPGSQNLCRAGNNHLAGRAPVLSGWSPTNLRTY